MQLSKQIPKGRIDTQKKSHEENLLSIYTDH